MKFLQLSDIAESTVKVINKILDTPVALRTTAQTTYLTLFQDYWNNKIISKDASGLIILAEGVTVPAGASGFRKGAFFVKTDAVGNGLYQNIGDTTSANFSLLEDQINAIAYAIAL